MKNDSNPFNLIYNGHRDIENVTQKDNTNVFRYFSIFSYLKKHISPTYILYYTPQSLQFHNKPLYYIISLKGGSVTQNVREVDNPTIIIYSDLKCVIRNRKTYNIFSIYFTQIKSFIDMNQSVLIRKVHSPSNKFYKGSRYKQSVQGASSLLLYYLLSGGEFND